MYMFEDKDLPPFDLHINNNLEIKKN